MTDPINNEALNQTDYLKLFMQELTYQDPLKPVDNREFMAQMAQFSSLQEARSTNELLRSLLGMNSANQSLGLLGKKVTITDIDGEGRVNKVEFANSAAPQMTVIMNDGTVHQVALDEVNQVWEA